MNGRKRLSKALTIIFGLIVLGLVVAVVVTRVFPAPEEAYTEFYILGPGGKAVGYPFEFTAGDEQSVIIGIISHERDRKTYRVDVEAGGTILAAAGPFVLDHLEKYEEPIVFTVNSAGSQQQVTFLLYKEGETEAYRSLYLPVDVSPPP